MFIMVIKEYEVIFFLFRAVKFTSKLFGRALSRRIKATVLYATETGKSQMYADKLAEIFSHAFHSQVKLMSFFFFFKF
jgi:nitric-oxide synthase